MMQKYQTLKKKIITSDYNKLTNDILDAKIIYKELINKSGISRSINNNDLDG